LRNRVSRSPRHGEHPVELDRLSLGGRGRALASRTALVFVLAVLLALAASPCSFAGQSRPYTGESFGPDGLAGPEVFQEVKSIAVDQASGEIYVLDNGGSGTVYKFDASGEPVDFSSTGTNAITGVGRTALQPQGQIAVAPPRSAGGTAGDIYVAHKGEIGLQEYPVTVYASSGEELGTVGEGEDIGVAVDPAGHLFINASLLTSTEPLTEYVPSGNPPRDSDASGSGGVTSPELLNLALDGAGHIYMTGESGLYKLEGIKDPSPKVVDPNRAPTFALNPGNGEVYADEGELIRTYDRDGNELGTFGAGQLTRSGGVAVNASTDEVYAGDTGATGVGTHRVKIFGTPVIVPTVRLAEATTTSPFEASLSGTVDPESLAVTSCVFEYGTTTTYGNTAPCEALPPTNSDPDPVAAHLEDLKANGVTYHVRLVAANANGSEATKDQTFQTGATVVTEPAAPIGESIATLHGRVFPNNLQYTECKFEYGMSGNPGFEDEVPCTPEAAGIPPGASPQEVEAELSGLSVNNASYRFRLVATDGEGTIVGRTLTFTTSGEPQISEVRAADADQTSATLEALVDPRGFGTAYRIEWGTTPNYGNTATSGSIGADEAAQRLRPRLTGLSPATTYHYRVVATSTAGTTVTPDRELETLGACGLPERRCYELVSPRDPGQVGRPGEEQSNEIRFQGTSASGTLAYSVAGGLPGTTKGAQVLYVGTRGATGWASSQFSPPIVAQGGLLGSSSGSSLTLGMSPDLSCAIVASNQPLTDDAVAKSVVEDGGVNLYRRNPDGSYTLITDLPPENPGGVDETGFATEEYELVGFSPDCQRIYFESTFHYPRVGGVDQNSEVGVKGWRLYEWNDGSLRPVGLVPDGSAETAAPAVAADPKREITGNYANDVSADGSRIFFSAERRASDNTEEIGRIGLFVREDGTVTRDVSKSETAVPDLGATFEYATEDGSRVFFTANAGLTAETSSEGTDLYEYDLGTDELTDLSPEPGPHGAEVGDVPHGALRGGLVGASRDGSVVYFVAQGQLDPGHGGTFEENQADGTISLYRVEDGSIRYVATVSRKDLKPFFGLVTRSFKPTSRVSADGRYLLFQSLNAVTGYESGGAPEAFLYDSEATAEPMVCLSCRTDGRPSLGLLPNPPLATQKSPFRLNARLVFRSGRPLVFFESWDRLASGATEGNPNLYEWAHGQVFNIVSEPPGLNVPPEHTGEENFSGGHLTLNFADASEDGTDLYFAVPAALNWEDKEGRPGVWDARIGGGFAEPQQGTACEPTVEGSCSSPAAAVPPTPGASSATVSGPENAKHKNHKKKKHRKKNKKKHGRHRRAQKQSGKGHGKKKHPKKDTDNSKRRAHTDRRAGK
jgi:hypothetical protein